MHYVNKPSDYIEIDILTFNKDDYSYDLQKAEQNGDKMFFIYNPKLNWLFDFLMLVFDICQPGII